MPPRLFPRPLKGLLPQLGYRERLRHVCLICSTTHASDGQKSQQAPRRSFPTEAAAAAGPPTASNARAELEQALVDINKHAANYVNLSRLHLALLGLRQPAGEESIRVAVLSVANGSSRGTTAKEVLGLLLADPLKKEEDWEKNLRNHDVAQPLAVRVGPEEEAKGMIEKKGMLKEIKVSSAVYNGHNLELILMEVNPPTQTTSKEVAEEALLDMPVEIASNTGRFSVIMTPVHKALVVADGVMGVSSVTLLPPNENDGTIYSSVNITGHREQDTSLPFHPIDVSPAREAVNVFRLSLDNAIAYQRLWSQSNMSALAAWLRSDTQRQIGTTKPAVRKLVASVLRNTLATARTAEESRRPIAAVEAPKALHSALSGWAEKAHRELQDELDKAFTGRRWRKLGWWKLFWRADDVGMLTSEMVSQKFLPHAENELVFLAGRIQQSREGFVSPEYSQPAPTAPNLPAETSTGTSSTSPQVQQPPTVSDLWPRHISFTRTYLLRETIPALQALAQKLVLQTAGTFGATTALSGLLYVSGATPMLYSAGAVAALGAVFSLRRLQSGWETARGFWEGEVREEGRKAVRAAEKSVNDVLEGQRTAVRQESGDFKTVKALVERAEDALKKLK